MCGYYNSEEIFELYWIESEKRVASESRKLFETWIQMIEALPETTLSKESFFDCLLNEDPIAAKMHMNDEWRKKENLYPLVFARYNDAIMEYVPSTPISN